MALVFLIVSCDEKQGELKSEIKTQNDTIVGVKIYNPKGHLIFDKTTQIIEDWDNDLMTWMTANFYAGNKVVTKYYAHSNLTLNKTIFDYDPDNKLRETYTVSVTKPEIRERNPYKEIYSINNPDSLKKYIEERLTANDTLSKKNKKEKESEKFFTTYRDDNGLLTKEFWTLIDSAEILKKVEKYDGNNNLISSYTKSQYNENLNEYKYDKQGNLIEEIETRDLDEGRFQRKEHIYDNDNLVKTNFYHGNDLAFIYGYQYQDTLLIREIKTRITNAKAFANRKEREVIEYKYEYYK